MFQSSLANILLLLPTDSPKNVEIAVLPSGKIREGNSLTLICMSNANPSVTNYSWFLIKEANVSHIGFHREFFIKAASQKDDGQYFCIAKNDMGSQNSTVAALKVEGNREYFNHEERNCVQNGMLAYCLLNIVQ